MNFGSVTVNGVNSNSLILVMDESEMKCCFLYLCYAII